MKKLVILSLLAINFAVFGQDQKLSTLNVTGAARVNTKPDLGILNISVSEVRPKMSDAIKALGEKSNYYNALLKKLGFSEGTIRTTNFSVSKHMVYRHNEYVDSGYIASQNIRMEFAYDQQTLQKIIFEFSKSEKPIDFNFNFELSEQLKKDVQAKIIEQAIKDAKDKANTMATSADVKLIKIKKISYNASEQGHPIEFLERKYNYAASAAKDNLQSFNFTPEDIIMRDSVSIEWIIE